MPMLFFDTSAWVEYFIGGPKGLKIKSILESDVEIITPVIVLIELSCKAHRENVDFGAQLDFIKQNSVILKLDEEMVMDTGKIYVEMRGKSKKSGIVDAIIAVAANAHNAQVVTCDYDFKDLPSVRFVS